MDTNKMREQFEAWAIGHFLNVFDRNILQADEWGDYVLGNVRMAWTAWQASREAVVVELPEALSSAALDEVEVSEVLLAGQGLSNLAGALGCAYLICKELPVIRSAIEAQGLKVKP